MPEIPSDLKQIMRMLRSPNGCPWDQKQTHTSLKKYLVEESYECLDAIDNQDDANLKEELGDVWLQVVFHAQLAEERGAFNLADVERSICEKMVRRHPHVFGETKVTSAEEVKVNWEAIKKQEKQAKDRHLLNNVVTSEPQKANIQADIPNSLPIVQRVQKIQDRVSKMGFEWRSINDAIDKLQEEVAEIRQAVEQQDLANMEEELGDCFFALLKVARLLAMDPELALKKANDKFVKRFEAVLAQCEQAGQDMQKTEIEVLMTYWKLAKG